MLRNTRILIVDDHPTNIAILEEILGEHYTLKTATCGEEALTIALDFKPALILLDIMMPGIGGYETCRRIRAHPSLRHIKIIMVSARALVAERLQGYEAGADDYITKPFDEEELVAKVRVHMRLRSLEEVEQFTSNVLTLLRHETRTPLNGMLAPLQMLRAEAEMVRGTGHAPGHGVRERPGPASPRREGMHAECHASRPVGLPVRHDGAVCSGPGGDRQRHH